MNHIKIYIPTIQNEKKKKKYKSYTQGDNGNWNPGVMIQQLCERYSWTSYGKKKKKYKSYTQGDNGNWNPVVMIQQLCERYSWTSYGTDTNRHTTIGKNFIIN